MVIDRSQEVIRDAERLLAGTVRLSITCAESWGRGPVMTNPSLKGLQDHEIPRAEVLVAEGAQRIEEQRKRLTGRNPSRESEKLLRVLEDTQKLLLSHLDLLRREASELLK